MKICHLVPGSGGTFYCQNCLRDYGLVRELKRQGHDVLMLPLYLPPFGDDVDTEGSSPVFFGGVNVYLRERFPLFRRTPGWIDRLFDSSWLLKLAASQEGSTNAAQLGPMTLSMLEGRNGNQQKGYERIVEWLSCHERPEIIHISNALLLGLAPEIKRAFDVPILCSLQDEEPWIESMPERYSRACWDAMARHAQHVSHFVATSSWYAGRMRERMRLADERISVVYPGVQVDETVFTEPCPDPPAIGFLSRLNEAQGLGILVDAFIEIKQDPAMKDLRLRATGGCTPADRAFVESIRAKLRARNLEQFLDIVSDFSRERRKKFLRTLSLLCVPVPQGEAFGIQLIEAMAQGVPVVQPRAGAYTEVVEATGGGVLYDPREPGALKDSLLALLRAPDRLRQLGRLGNDAIRERFTLSRAAREMISLYNEVLERTPHEST